MKRTKKSLWMSVLSILLCLSMLIGTTYAWFTDSVTTAGNRIVSGSLKVDLLHRTVDAQAGSTEWVSLKDNPDHKIFDYDKWEPGYTRFEKLKVENIGKLALKYQLSAQTAVGTEKLGANGERLSDVIDVYLYDGDSTAASFSELKTSGEWLLAGTLTEMLNTTDGFARGNVLPAGAIPSANAQAGEQTVSIALHMREEAGNEYQNLSIGDLYVTLVATQMTNEYDSFGNQYDKDSVFPSAKLNYSINAPVNLDANNATVAEVNLGGSDDAIKATVPAGTKLDEGTEYVTLSVTELLNTNSNITVEEGQQVRSVDVHVSGVAADNTTPIIVTVNGLMPAGYNMGSFALYHIENGTPVQMTWVYESQLDAHNEFAYDAATGNVKMALCTFSEVAVVADAHTEWNGGTDHSWYLNATEHKDGNGKTHAPGTVNNPYIIASADQLNSFGQIVGGMATGVDGLPEGPYDFNGKYVKLVRDLDLGTEEGHTKMYEGDDPHRQGKMLTFYPIGYYFTDNYEETGKHYSTVYAFGGNFDGNGHTISNFYQNTWDMVGDNEYYPESEHRYRDGMGLFGYIYDADVKNLTVDNFKCDGEFTPTGVIAAYAHAASFTNISITNCNPRVYNTGNGGIVGIGGLTSKKASETTRKAIRFENITVDQTNKITALWGSWDVSCSGIMGMLRGPDSVDDWMKVELVNCHVAAQIDAYNDVCGNYQYYWYRYSGMMVGSIRTHVTDENGYTVPNTSMITATNCTVHFGDWNNYYYCELVANSLASYTHDHQFSRLTMVKSVDKVNLTYTDLDGVKHDIPKEGRYNYVMMKPGVTEHGDDSVFCFHYVDGVRHLHSDAGYETKDIDGDGVVDSDVLKEDRQHYYLPFNNQLFQGYGWGVKNIPVGKFDGITILDTNEGYSAEKFVVRDNVTTVALGYNVLLGDIFREKADNVLPIASSQVKVSVTKLDTTTGTYVPDNDSFYFAYSKNSTDWRKSQIRFNNPSSSGPGTYVITIQDYYYCTATSVTVQVDWYHARANTDTVYIWTDTDRTAPTSAYNNTAVTNMTEAYAKLAQLNAASGRKGGDIVIIGNYTQSALFRAPDHEGTVNIRCIDSVSTFWVGERTGNVGVRYFCGGPTVFNNIRVEATEENSSNLTWNVVGNFHDLTIGENIIMDRKGNDFILVLGAQGGGVNSGARDIEPQDATLNVYGGDWSEVVGSIRNTFTSQAKPYNDNSHIAEFADTEYHLEINVGGDVVINKFFAHSRSMEEEAIYDADGNLYNSGVSDRASCVVNLLGGTINSWVAKDHLTKVEMGYGRGYTTYIGKNFDLDKSFNATAEQDSEIYYDGYVKQIGISGESVLEYDPDYDTTGKGKPVLTTGESYLIIEPKDGVDRINEIKDNSKVRLDTFKYVGYGAPVRPVPVTYDTDEFYVGWTGEGDGATPETFMNSIGWKTGIILDKPTTDEEGGFEEDTDGEETVATAATAEKYPENLHLWYYFENYGGTYVAVQKMYLGGATAIKNAPTAITLTAVDKNGHDYRLDGDELGYFIMKAAPIGTKADGTLKEVAPYYLRVINSEVIFDNITIFSRAGSEMHPDNNYGITNITDSQNFYFIVDQGGRMVIRDNVTIASKLEGRAVPYVNIDAGGVLYLEKFGFSSYNAGADGAGTIVLSDELICKVNADTAAYAEDIALLNAFVTAGGKISDEHGIFLNLKAVNTDKTLLVDMDGSIPVMNTTTNEIEYKKVVFVEDGGAGNGSSAEYALSNITEAYGVLGISGGTIVVSGAYSMTEGIVGNHHTKPVTVTQSYNGVDYSEGSTLTFNTNGAARKYNLYGDTTFKDITFETSDQAGSTTKSYGLVFGARYYKIVMDNVSIKGFKSADYGNNFSIIGGFNTGSLTDVQNAEAKRNITGSNIIIESVTAISGNGVSIMGLDRQISTRDNPHDANITINGGDIYRVYPASDVGQALGALKFTINGGDFSKMNQIFYRGCSKAESVVMEVNGGDFTNGDNKIGCATDVTNVVINVVTANVTNWPTEINANITVNADTTVETN